MTLHVLLVLAGLFHFALLPVSLAVPRVMDWRRELAGLHPLSRQIVLVHGGFIVGIIIAFGALTLAFAGSMAAGTEPGRTLAGLMGAFWGARLVIQLAYYHPKHWPKMAWVMPGRYALTALFTYWAAVYGAAFAAYS
jgi:hypothetical protein